MKPPFFIVGCPRSGTTLLRNLLRAHPSLTVPPESHFIPRCYKAFGDPADKTEARRLARYILSTSWVKDWGLDLGPSDFEDCRTCRELVCRLYEAFARKEAKPRWGDKTPQYVTELPTLWELFPDARVIHIIRDGRDVAHSWLRTRFHPRNCYAAAKLWKEFVERGIRDGRSPAAGAYHEVRYEALLGEPAAVLREISAFLDEPYVDEAPRLNPPVAETHPVYRWQISSSAIVTNNSGKWRANLSPKERAMFEAVAGDLLASLGYELEGHNRSISQWERLYWEGCQGVAAFMTTLGDLRQPDRFKTRLSLRLADARAHLRSRRGVETRRRTPH